MSDRTIQIHLSNNNASIENNDYVYSLNLTSSVENHIWISLKHAIIPYSWYNVNSNNNKFVITDNANATYTFTLDEGNYTGITLASYLTTLVSDYNSGQFFYPLNSFSCSYNTKTSKLTMTCNYQFVILSSSTCLNLLGFYKNTTYTSTLSTHYTLTSVKPIDLIPVKCICISLPEINTDNYSLNLGLNNKSILCSIPVDVSPMGLIIYKNENFSINTENNDLDLFMIKLIDQDGNVINLNGLNFYMTFEFNIIKFTE
jgi:hypothetical protein